MNFETIVYETEGPLAWIRLNRPEQQNAIDDLDALGGQPRCDGL